MGAVGERIGTDGLDIIRDGDRGQAAVGERCISDLVEILSEPDVGEAGTVVECVILDRCDGIRDGDGTQEGTVSEGAVAYRDDGTAEVNVGKGRCHGSGLHIEHVIGDLRDLVAEGHVDASAADSGLVEDI